MPSSNSSIGVSFRVSGGELDTYLSRIQQRATELSRQFIRNAEKESDVAKDNLRSYNDQLKALERKLQKEAEIKTLQAELNREAGRKSLREDIQSRRDQLDASFSRGEITKRQHRVQGEKLTQEEEKRQKEIDDRFRAELASHRDQRRDNSLLLRAMRENQDAIKTTSAQELNQMRKGDEALVDAVKDDEDPQAYLANKLASQSFIEEQAKLAEKGAKGSEDSTFHGFLKALAVDKVGGMIAQIPSAKDSIDFIKPIMSTLGMTLGFLPGQALDAILGSKIIGTGIGQTSFAALGMQLGEKMGEFAGELLVRSYRSRQELTSANFRLQALTGNNLGIEAFGEGPGMGGRGISSLSRDLQDYGATFKQVAELQYKIAKAQGSSHSLGTRVEDALALKQALGVEEGTYLSLSELLRSSKEGNRDVLKLVGGVAAAGKNNIFAHDRTFLSEFMEKNFTGLQKTLLQTQNHVASGTTFDLLRRFDSIGGPFAARDSRSSGLINTIHSSLVNPGSDNVKALAFLALREQNPHMDFYRLKEEQQKGLASPTYLKAMIKNVDRLGGTEDFKMMNLAGLLGLQDNLAANRLIWKNKDKLMSGQISTKELVGIGEYSRDSIYATGKAQTDIYTKEAAGFENAFVEGAAKGMEVVTEGMKRVLGKMVEELSKYVGDRIDAEIQKLRSSGDSEPAPDSVAKNTTFSGRGVMQTNDGKILTYHTGPKY